MPGDPGAWALKNKLKNIFSVQIKNLNLIKLDLLIFPFYA